MSLIHPHRDRPESTDGGPAPAGRFGRDHDAGSGGPSLDGAQRDTDTPTRHDEASPATRNSRPESPDGPTDIGAQGWKATLKRTFSEFKDDNLTDWAAALTYYAVLAIFPALLALVSLLGLVGQSATQALLDNLTAVTPGSAKDIVTSSIQNLQKSQGTAGVTFIIGLAGAVWSASGYVAAFMRASNSVYDVEEGRPFYWALPVRVGVTLVLLIAAAVCAVGVVLSGGLADQAGQLLGVGDTGLTVWNIAKWPIMVLIVATMFAFLYWASPNAKQPKFRWLSPGGLLAVLLWIVASAAFAFYLANFASYNKTYGSLGGVIGFLTWLWISNTVLLLGAELNAELERSRRIETGQDPKAEPYVELRSEKTLG